MAILVLVFGMVNFADQIGWTRNLSEDWERWYFLIFFSSTMTMLATLATWIALLLKIHYVLKFCLPSSPAERRRQVVKWRREG